MIADFWPAVFVMENVCGLLSSRIDGELVFNQICNDLRNPSAAIPNHQPGRAHTYSLHSLTSGSLFDIQEPSEFVIRSEHYGIPQTRNARSSQWRKPMNGPATNSAIA